MVPMTIHFVGKTDSVLWPELKREQIVHLGNGSPPINVAIIEGGMASGKPSVMLRIDLPDGRHVLAETTAALVVTLGKMIAGRYPDLSEG
ncbi:MAG TPA: hypothetical protein VK630_15915 [Reyranella sp.]|nr:hypothetical protein [Reyranella sp.]